MKAAVMLVVVLVFLLVLHQRAQGTLPAAATLPPPGNPARGPDALYDPTTGQGGLSTRQQIETGVGSVVGAGAGLYVCAGNPACAGAGAYIGGVAAPYVSHGVEEGAKWTWNNTLGRLF
ncbi:MAG: hypothetical protein ACJ8GN_02090 [Longimicrobiaceae bacterium]